MRASGVLLFALIVLLGATAYLLTRDDRPVQLRFSAGSATGQYYHFANALAELARRQDAGLEIEVLTSDGADDNARAVSEGRAELGLVQSDTVIGPAVDVVSILYPEVLHIVARSEAGIRTPGQLGGKRIAVMPRGGGSNALFLQVVGHYGYAAQDLTLIPYQPDEAIVALEKGEVDALARVIALGNDSMRSLLQRPDIDLVPIDQSDAIQMFAPALENIVIPKGTISGRPPKPAEDIHALAVRAILVANSSVDSGTVRKLSALINESRNALLALDRQAALLGGAEHFSGLGFPLHPGARSYLDADKPPFVIEYAEPLGLGLSAIVVLASLFWRITRWIEAYRKNRGDAYTGALTKAMEEIRLAQTTERLDALEAEIYIIFNKVIDDIDKDRLAEATVPAFDMVWRSATDLLEKRRMSVRDPDK